MYCWTRELLPPVCAYANKGTRLDGGIFVGLLVTVVFDKMCWAFWRSPCSHIVGVVLPCLDSRVRGVAGAKFVSSGGLKRRP
ncbi:hypothetical protein PoB_001186500 [Plakobranchus ocellatus]|uniref:Uncharacterized protein n=1 Tax=Plakobranchus ocellatus TaxID=259542 RepID=A0AAV3YSD9_9GAST|nr:hypothetical protein PoB_001186500 [Plakobranchus ocellatus]